MFSCSISRMYLCSTVTMFHLFNLAPVDGLNGSSSRGGRSSSQCGIDRRVPHHPIFNNIIIPNPNPCKYLLAAQYRIFDCGPNEYFPRPNQGGPRKCHPGPVVALAPAPDTVICRWRRPRPSAGAGAGDGNPGAGAGLG